MAEEKRDGSIVAYTDGACSNNGRYGAAAGIGVWWADNHPWNVSRPLEGTPTSNRAEIHAAIEAMRIARRHGYRRLAIRTDSEYLLKGATEWIRNWLNNGWRNIHGGPVANKKDWMLLLEQQEQLEHVSWEHVYSHRGHYGNEQADKLAKDAIFDDY